MDTSGEKEKDTWGAMQENKNIDTEKIKQELLKRWSNLAGSTIR